jgi:hypothetical protein
MNEVTVNLTENETRSLATLLAEFLPKAREELGKTDFVEVELTDMFSEDLDALQRIKDKLIISVIKRERTL